MLNRITECRCENNGDYCTYCEERFVNVPPDESPADQFVADAVERMERGSWKWLKAQLEVDDDQTTD
jgi:hypothetical protein